MINLPIETVNAILGYLGTRPYQEVYQMIAAIQAAAAAAAAEEKKDE
jgi:hypothetical protein